VSDYPRAKTSRSVPAVFWSFRWSRWNLAAAALLVFACGGGGGDSLALADLEHEELGAMCEQLNDEFVDPEAALGICKNWAAATGGVKPGGSAGTAVPDPAGCEAALPSCPAIRGPQVCAAEHVFLTSCEATVADLRACYERLRTVYRADAMLGCSELSVRRARSVGITETPPHLRDSPCTNAQACFLPQVVIPSDHATGTPSAR
jgi:hypothetical protein